MSLTEQRDSILYEIKRNIDALKRLGTAKDFGEIRCELERASLEVCSDSKMLLESKIVLAEVGVEALKHDLVGREKPIRRAFLPRKTSRVIGLFYVSHVYSDEVQARPLIVRPGSTVRPCIVVEHRGHVLIKGFDPVMHRDGDLEEVFETFGDRWPDLLGTKDVMNLSGASPIPHVLTLFHIYNYVQSRRLKGIQENHCTQGLIAYINLFGRPWGMSIPKL